MARHDDHLRPGYPHMTIDKDKKPQPSITDLPEPASADTTADKVKGGRMNLRATESGDVTQDGSRGGDQG